MNLGVRVGFTKEEMDAELKRRDEANQQARRDLNSVESEKPTRC